MKFSVSHWQQQQTPGGKTIWVATVVTEDQQTEEYAAKTATGLSALLARYQNPNPTAATNAA